MKEKVLIDGDLTQESLVNLRDEIYNDYNTFDAYDNPLVKEILFKINSCLYSGYKLGARNEKTI